MQWIEKGKRTHGAGICWFGTDCKAKLFYNRYKNRDSDRKEGQPLRAGLLVSD